MSFEEVNLNVSILVREAVEANSAVNRTVDINEAADVAKVLNGIILKVREMAEGRCKEAHVVVTVVNVGLGILDIQKVKD